MKLNKNAEFVIENYQAKSPFASFFPGIAGLWGRPIWTFYVSRAQAIASFGISDKDHPIMEFYPANKAYAMTSIAGFRTFIKSQGHFYDVFNEKSSPYNNRMIISPHELTLKELNPVLKLETTITYFTIPNDSYAALARIVCFRSLSKKTINFEVLDGMPQIIPYGINNWCLKNMSRTIEAWINVENLNNKIPFLRLRVESTDTPEIVRIEKGNFYLCFDETGLLKPVVDPAAIFAHIKDFTYPHAFLSKKQYTYPRNQATKNKTPCCMAYKRLTLKPHDTHTIYALIGNIDSLDKLNKNSKRIADAKYIEEKQKQNKDIIHSLSSDAFTHSGSKNFDAYCAQNFLDNTLRGGRPISIKHARGSCNLYVYSRKHGDLERDYNNFLIEPSYFSQGNGSFRDVNQNRRNDAWFNPAIGEENIFTFFNLLQTDGYNPLVIKPSRLMFNGSLKALTAIFKKSDIEKIKVFLRTPFTIGELFLFIEKENIRLSTKREKLLEAILSRSKKTYNAEHGEGFWSDHWYYCLDLLESYLRLYPENLNDILFKAKKFTFFDNDIVLKPRNQRYVLKNGRLSQGPGTTVNCKKRSLIQARDQIANISRTQNGRGPIYKTTLIAKMLIVIANKFASLDPFGVGIEMEADKPGWCDSLNGLPGLFGSSTCETLQLKRWIQFLLKNIRSRATTIKLPTEALDMLTGLNNIPRSGLGNCVCWDRAHMLKENYRARTMMGYSGKEKGISTKQVCRILEAMLEKIDEGLKKARDAKTGLYYSYFINEPVEYKQQKGKNKSVLKPLKFKQRPLPLFLEGIMHGLSIADNSTEAKRVYSAVKKSELYDKKLKMYKINAPLKSMPDEIGRSRVFTPGWLENESIWLHMEYKYMLSMLKSGLYNEFYEDFKDVLIPFNPPGRYGRSILENSSFLVSSAFPRKELHGKGFIARLSGVTAEFVHIWLIMCAGNSPFYLDKEEKLFLQLRPILPGWLFSRKQEKGFNKNTFAFKFLGKTLVIYHNPKRKNTYGRNAASPVSITIKPYNKEAITLKSQVIPPSFSRDVRDGKIEKIDVVLEGITTPSPRRCR